MHPPPTPPLVPVKSSHLHSVGYDPNSHALSIRFSSSPSSKLYVYHGVPPALHSQLLSAPSKGKFFIAHIRDRFSHTHP